MPDTPVAIVTGASRGIGRAGALALAEAGFDVVVSSRTVKEGEGVAEANSVRETRNLSVPGSLERTAQEVEERGRRALIVPLDLMDRESVVALPKRVLEEWGRVDVLFNNAVFRGVGNLDRIEDLTPQSMMDVFTGNFIHQILLIQGVLPHMKERGSGVIANMVSGSARWDPPGPPGEGGWGIVYSGSKAAFGRVAGGMNAEHLAAGHQDLQPRPGQRHHRGAQGGLGLTTSTRASSAARPPRRPARWWHGSRPTPVPTGSWASGSTRPSSARTSGSSRAGRWR